MVAQVRVDFRCLPPLYRLWLDMRAQAARQAGESGWEAAAGRKRLTAQRSSTLQRETSSGARVPTAEPLYYGPANLSQLVYMYTGGQAHATRALSILTQRHQHMRDDTDYFFVEPDGNKPEVHQELSISAASELVRKTVASDLMDRRELDVCLCAESVLLDYKSNMGAIYPIGDGDLARLAMCAVASQSRTVPESARLALMSALHSVMDSPEVMRLERSPSLLSVQLAMIMSISDDLHAVAPRDSHTLLWSRVGLGIRQGLELVRCRVLCLC